MKTKCTELGVATMKPLYLFQETLPSSDRKQSCINNFTALRNFEKKLQEGETTGIEGHLGDNVVT